MPQVHTDISDLFFNTDHADAAIFDDKGNFSGYDDTVLEESADSFIDALHRLGVEPALKLTSHELVADFLGRV
jgi:hypothetical protein